MEDGNERIRLRAKEALQLIALREAETGQAVRPGIERFQLRAQGSEPGAGAGRIAPGIDHVREENDPEALVHRFSCRERFGRGASSRWSSPRLSPQSSLAVLDGRRGALSCQMFAAQPLGTISGARLPSASRVLSRPGHAPG